MRVTLAIDAMGGDFGPAVVIKGASLALSDYSLDEHGIDYLFYGNFDLIEAQIKLYPNLADISKIIHADSIITSETRPASAVRLGKKTNMGMAVDAVVSGKANAVVSGGNTGAYMALSKVMLKTLEDVDRPAITGIFPTSRGRSVVLDLGANIDCSPENLVEFALMGEAFARLQLGVAQPTVGLLNVGVEDLKGNAIVQEAAVYLRKLIPDNFYGYIEGNDIAAGTTDVVVTDGFTGNVVLKTIEGTAKSFRDVLKNSLSSSIGGKIGYLLAQGAFEQFRQRIDPSLYNGAPFLGLKGLAIKSHGGANAVGFANAIKVAINLVKRDFIQEIEKQLALIDIEGKGPK
ncbi:MAG: phosphate acyltransferase PlsX [Alphaproteobacteria bacterium]|nr:phosphate acyltransferase PlsX [Alphaproteobacteria bacterium]